MEQQLALFETPEQLPNKYRLFLGIFPDAEAVDLICDQQTALRDKFRLSGRLRPRNILHVTLHHIGDYPYIPEQMIASTIEICARVLASQSSVEVILDHVKSYRGRPGNLPFVLVNPTGNAALLEFHRVLVTELIRHRLAKRGDLNFDPHVTMLYDGISVPEQPVRPVSWRAREVVLILSHLGLTKYDRLKSWSLSE
jgi:2'-5' RNA ligase